MKKGNHSESNSNKNVVYLSIIFLIIIVIKIVLSLNFYSPLIIPDELTYDKIASNIIAGKLMLSSGGPGYPLFVSLAYLVSSDKVDIHHVMLMINSLISTSIIFPAYFLLKKYCPDGISLLAATTATLLTSINFFNFTIMTENLITPLFLFSTWFLIESYGTDDKKWQLLASASVVYEYIIKSNMIAALVGFIAAFAYYVIINSKNNRIGDLILKKNFLLATFVIFLVTWLICAMDPGRSLVSALILLTISVVITYIYYILISKNNYIIHKIPKDNKIIPSVIVGLILVIFLSATVGYIIIDKERASNVNIGSSYDALNIVMSLFDIITSTTNLIWAIKILLNETIYMILGSFFIFIAIVYYLIFYRKKSYSKNSPLLIALVYYSITLMIIILADIALNFYTNSTLMLMGRYVEPLMPGVIVFGTIFLYDMKKVSEKQLNYFIALFIAIFTTSLFLIEMDYSIIYGFMRNVDNSSLWFLHTVYTLPFPEIIVMAISVMLLFLMYRSVNDKKYMKSLLVIFIIISLFATFDIYGQATSDLGSNFRKDNPIDRYLNANTDRNTILYIDDRMTDSEQLAALTVYAYWNKGDYQYIDGNDSSLVGNVNNDKYLITTNKLSYKFEINDDVFNLYKVD